MGLVFLTWTSLKMEMDSDFKKNEQGWRGGFSSPHVGIGDPLRRSPHVNHVPRKVTKVEGVYD